MVRKKLESLSAVPLCARLTEITPSVLYVRFVHMFLTYISRSGHHVYHTPKMKLSVCPSIRMPG